MKIKIHERRNLLNNTSDFSFKPIQSNGGSSVAHDPEAIVHLVTVPVGAERVKSDTGQDRLDLRDGRLYSANAVMWYASNGLHGFSLADELEE